MDDNTGLAYFQAPWISILVLILLIVVPLFYLFLLQFKTNVSTKSREPESDRSQPLNCHQLKAPGEDHTVTGPQLQRHQLTSSNIREVLNNVWEARHKWYNIGIELKLKVSDLDAIQRKNHENPDNCITEMLVSWLRWGGATWEDMIDALKHKTVGFCELADRIAAEVITVKTVNDVSDLMYSSGKSQKPGFECPKCGKCSLEQFLEGDCPKYKSFCDSAFPYLDVNAENLTDNEMLTLQVKLRKETSAIITEFSNLILYMRKSFKDKKIDPQDMATSALGIATRESSTCSLLDSLDIKKVCSVDWLVGHLLQNGYISFFNYHIVEYLISSYGTSEDQGMFQMYKTKFKVFCKRSIFEVPTYVFGPVPSDGEKLAFKVTEEMLNNFQFSSSSQRPENFSPSSPSLRISSKTLRLSLENTLTIQRKVAEALGLKNVGCLVFLSVSKGCIELTFSVPRVVMGTIKRQLNTACTEVASFASLEAFGIHILCGPPSKPFATEVTSDSVTLKWSKPEYHGFHPIKCYYVHYQAVFDKPGIWRILQTKCPKESFEINLPRNGKSFLFSVQAVTDIGAGIRSENSDPIELKCSEEHCFIDKISSKPGKPRATRVTHDCIQPEWTKPEQNLDSITSYTVLCNDPPNQWIEQRAITTKEMVNVSQPVLETRSYSFKVQPEYENYVGLESDISEPIAAKMIIPSKPGKPIATNVTHDSIQLKWTKPEQGAYNIIAYVVFYRTHAGNNPPDKWIEEKVKSAKDMVTISQLLERTVYSFKVQPECEDGVGLESDTSEPITTKMIVPSKPGKPIVTNVTHDSIQLEWTKPEQGAHNVTSYTIVYRSTADPSHQWTKQDAIIMVTVDDRTYERVLVTQLVEKTTYYFKVRPVYTAGNGLESDISDPIKTKGMISSQPGKPRCSNVSHNSIQLEWTKPEQGAHNIISYRVFYHSHNDPPHKWVGQKVKSTGEMVTVSQLLERTTYSFKVQPECEDGLGLESDISEPITTKTIIPSKPGKPIATNVTQDSIQLEWTKPEQGAHNIVNYHVFYHSNNDPPDEWIEHKVKSAEEVITVSQLFERTLYLCKVQPECEDGFGLESDISEPITTNMIVPSKPGKPIATNVTHDSIQLKWTKPEQGAHNITSYTIFYHPAISDPPEQWIQRKEKCTIDTCTLTVPNLLEYTIYCFKIRPECEVDIGQESDISDPIQTKMIIPSKPDKPKASNVTHDSIQLEWIKPEQGAHNISSYTVFYRSISDPPDSWGEHKAVTNEEVLLPQLSENVMYCFKIRPECKAGVGLESDISDPIRTNMIIPSKPGQPKALNITHNSIQLEWTKPEQGAHNITSYTILYHSKNDSSEYQEWTEQKVDTVKEKVIVTQLLESTTYFFKIQPNCGNILGLESDTSEPFKTKMILPSKPGQPKALNITHDSIELEWTKPEQGAHNVASYTVFICTINESSDSLWKQEVETADEFVNISHLSEKTIYFFKVLPNCDKGCGVESDISGPIMTTVIPPSKPGKPRATNITHDSIELEWTKPEQGAHNVTSYTVLYRFDSGQWNEQITASNDAKVIMSQLKEHTIYFFKIRPECETKLDPGILIESEISEPIKTKMIIPSKPSEPTALKVTHNSIQLEWTKPEQGAHNITSYTVLYHSKKDSPEYQEWTEQKVDTVKEKVIVSQLLEKTVYFFKVQPRCGDVLGLESDVSEPLKTEMIVPGKPGKPNPTKVTHDSIELEWTKPEQGAHNVTSYTVFICTVNECSDSLWKQEAETVDELINISHLSEKTIYCFKVQPNYDEGCGLESDISGPIMTTVIPPSKPGKPRATNITHDSIELEWTKPELGAHNVTSYTVLYRLDSGQWNEQITTSNDAKVIMSQLKEHTIYFFKIRPECETKLDPGILIEGEISEPIKTKMIIPGKPSKPTAFNVTHNSIQLEWTKPEQGAHNITSYTILYHSKSDSPEYQEWTEQKVDTVKEKVIVSQLLEKTVYFFKVQPRCGDVLGLESDVSEPLKTEMIVPGKPGKPNPTKVTHDSIELEWTKPEQGAHNVTSYTVFICTVNECSDNLWKQEAETVDELVNISHLSERTIYCFKVLPICDEGCGLESDISGPIMTKVIPPSKPGKPKATNITHDSIELEWTKPEQGAHNVTSYTVLYCSNSDPPYKWKEHKALITNEMVVVSKLSEKTSYIFKILPECASGFGLESDVSESIVTKMIAPSNPGTPEASSITHNSIQLEWRKPEQGAHNVRNYTVFYRSSSDPPECWMKTLTVDREENVLVTNLLEDTSYYFKIRPEYEGDVGIESEVSDAIKTKISPGVAENYRQFEEAMKYGHIKTWNCKLVIDGAVASGKTSVMERILGNPPPSYRMSTPLPIAKPITTYKVSLNGKECTKVTTLEEHKAFLAKALIHPQNLAHSVPANQSKEAFVIRNQPVTTVDVSQVHQPEVSSDQIGKPPCLDSQPPTALLKHTDLDESNSETIASNKKVQEILQSVTLDEDMVKLMDQFSTSVEPLPAFRTLQIINSGGMPHFHEILSNFLPNLSFYIFVFRLCDELDSRPECYVDCKLKSDPVRITSNQTIEQLLQRSAQTIHSHCIGLSSYYNKGECPKILVIGTHMDLELMSKESQEVKNVKLLKILLPMLGKHILYHDVGTKKVMFPLNAIDTSRHSERFIFDQIRERLFTETSIPVVEVPLRWFALEILVEEMMETLKRGVLSREECFTAAHEKLYFCESEFDAAIRYLNELSVLFYYPRILPEVIFADLQVLLDKLLELFIAHYQRNNVKGKTDDWLKFYDFALVTVEFLSQEEFNKHYVPGLFEVHDLILLFRVLLIFVQFSNTELFVPALLSDLSNEDLEKRRIDFHVPSLALQFRDGGPPKGLFSFLLCGLVSSENDCSAPWSLSTDDLGSPVCHYRNCVQLDIPNSPVTMTLIDSYTHFEVHVDILDDDDLCNRYLPLVKEALYRTLQKASLQLCYPDSKPTSALVCPCGRGKAHVATISFDYSYWTCSLKNEAKKYEKLSPHQHLWLASKTAAPAIAPAAAGLTEYHLPELFNKLDYHSSSKWREIGIFLGFRRGELDIIQCKPLLLRNAPQSWLRAMLEEWLQWCPGDSRGSDSFPTVKELKQALRKCGLEKTADSIISLY